jgi:predicted enzyme related to lactoylglutathione lyase
MQKRGWRTKSTADPGDPPMSAPRAKLSFFKLKVEDLDEALAFWREAFGFEVTATFDEPEFLEHILALPGQEAGPNLMLVQNKVATDVTVGPGHGPLGLVCEDIEASYSHALRCGAASMLAPFDAGGVKVAIIRAPQGHEVELVQLPSP